MKTLAQFIDEATHVKIDVQGDLGSTNPTRYYKALGQLKVLMRNRIPAAGATDKLAKFFVDGKLFDQIESFVGKSPDADVRPLIKKRMKELHLKDPI